MSPRKRNRKASSSSPLPPPNAPETDIYGEPLQEADLEDTVAFFLETLEAGELDEEEAFEMLEDIRSMLDLHDPRARAHYADLIERLHRHAPDLYQHDIQYYHENLISDAVADGRWEAIPELLAPFVEKPERTIETFTRVIDQLTYHGQTQTLIGAMSCAWPRVSEATGIFDWAIDEFAGKLMLLHLFDYLDTAEAPRADDPALLEATAPYREWTKGWLERTIPPLTAPAPSAWQPADFSEAVDADQWHENVQALLLEFVADRHRAGVPFSRAYMAWEQLVELLHQQFTGPTVQPSPLVPHHTVLDKFLVELFPFLGAQPYKAAALMELLSAYLHFLARLGLIHPAEMDDGLAELQPLSEHMPRVLEGYGADPRAADMVMAAWSEEALAALRNDPELVQARAAPLSAPSPPPEASPRRPGALQTYTFKVTYLRKPSVWRTIEIAEDQTLDDLHYAIQGAVNFDADHLYSFFMSGRAWDDSTEYAHPYAEGLSAEGVRIRDLNLRMKQRFLYLYDYGDEHHFEVQLVGINPDAPKGKYPRVVERHGKNPPQYSGW